MNEFQAWLTTFIDEKGFNLEDTYFEFGNEKAYNFMPLSVVVEFASQCPEAIQRTIKDAIVEIDFQNGNAFKYFEYLTKGIAQQITNEQVRRDEYRE